MTTTDSPEEGRMTESDTLPIVYIWPNSNFGSDLLYVAMADDGEALKTHVCSSPGFAAHDLAGDTYKGAQDQPAWTSVQQLYVDKFGGWGDGEFYRIEWSRPPEWVIRTQHERKAAAEGHTLKARS